MTPEPSGPGVAAASRRRPSLAPGASGGTPEPRGASVVQLSTYLVVLGLLASPAAGEAVPFTPRSAGAPGGELFVPLPPAESGIDFANRGSPQRRAPDGRVIFFGSVESYQLSVISHQLSANWECGDSSPLFRPFPNKKRR